MMMKQPTQSDPVSNSLVLRRAMVRFNRSGFGLPEQAGWPFTKVVVKPGILTLQLFGTNLSLTPATVAPLEEYSQAFAYGQYANEHGFHIVPTLPITAGKSHEPIVRIDVSVRSKEYANTMSILQACGFEVISKSQQ